MLHWKTLPEEAGTALAEAAVVLPIVFMVLLGIYYFGMAFNTNATINRAAVAGARVAVAQSCSTCANPNTSPATATVASAVIQVLQASHIDPNKIQAYAPASPIFCPSGGSCTANNNVTVCNNVQLSPAVSPRVPACGVTVSFQYPFQFLLPFTSLNNQQITLSANAQMKSEF